MLSVSPQQEQQQQQKQQCQKSTINCIRGKLLTTSQLPYKLWGERSLNKRLKFSEKRRGEVCFAMNIKLCKMYNY